jgi:hypothetical protein
MPRNVNQSKECFSREETVWLSKYKANDATIVYKEISPSRQHFKHQNNLAHIAVILD